jgi:hypothetical protein
MGFSFSLAPPLQMAQTYQDSSGVADGCDAAANVQGTVLTYLMNNNVLESVSVNFMTHTDSGGVARDGFIMITCVAGGPTSNFEYTTIGDTGHKSQYEVGVTADCSKSGPMPPSPPGPPAPGAPGYWCVQNTTCLYGPQPSPTFKGGTEQQCAAICHPPLYMCKGGQCVASPTGGTLQECNAVC